MEKIAYGRKMRVGRAANKTTDIGRILLIPAQQPLCSIDRMVLDKPPSARQEPAIDALSSPIPLSCRIEVQ
jgi:hypothetical protein